MIIPKETIDDIIKQADIVDIISEYVPNLKRRGANYIALSPFKSEKTPSFNVSREKGIFKDFSSNKGGNVITFIMEHQNVSFMEALEIVAEKIGYKIDKKVGKIENKSEIENIKLAINKLADYYHQNLLSNDSEAFEYLKNRGLTYNSLINFQVGAVSDSWEQGYNFLKKNGFDDSTLIKTGCFKQNSRGKTYDFFKGRIVFPILDQLGRNVGFGGRIFRNNAQGAKYLNPPDTELYNKSKILYGYYQARESIKKNNRVLIVEGYLDIITLHSFGFDYSVAVCGTSLTEQHLDKLKNLTQNIYFLFDSDSAGINATEKYINLALRKGFNIKVVKLPEGEDPDSILQKNGKNVLEEYLNESLDFINYKIWAFTYKNGDIFTANYRSELLRQLASSISSIEDSLQHSFYVGKIADQLKLSQYEIETFFELLKKNNIDFQLKLIKKEDYYEQKNINLEKTNSSFEPGEKEILSLLIKNYLEIVNLLEKYELSRDLFISEKAKLLFDLIMLIPTDETNIINFLDNNDELSNSEKNDLIDLMVSDINFNSNLANQKSLVYQEKIFDELKDYIVNLKLFKLETNYDELINKMSNKENKITDEDKIKIKELNEKIENLKLEMYNE